MKNENKTSCISIDHVFDRRSDIRDVCMTWAMRRAECDTDHRMVAAELHPIVRKLGLQLNFKKFTKKETPLWKAQGCRGAWKPFCVLQLLSAVWITEIFVEPDESNMNPPPLCALTADDNLHLPLDFTVAGGPWFHYMCLHLIWIS